MFFKQITPLEVLNGQALPFHDKPTDCKAVQFSENKIFQNEVEPGYFTGLGPPSSVKIRVCKVTRGIQSHRQ